MKNKKGSVSMIGKRVRQLRQERGISQRKLAADAGLTPCHVEFIESGRIKSPRLDTLLKLSVALAVSRSRFFSVED